MISYEVFESYVMDTFTFLAEKAKVNSLVNLEIFHGLMCFVREDVRHQMDEIITFTSRKLSESIGDEQCVYDFVVNDGDITNNPVPMITGMKNSDRNAVFSMAIIPLMFGRISVEQFKDLMYAIYLFDQSKMDVMKIITENATPREKVDIAIGLLGDMMDGDG